MIELLYPAEPFPATGRGEDLPVIDIAGRVVARSARKDCHTDSRRLHPVVHLHVFDKKGQLYLQKRSADKDIAPGLWDTAVGGHVDYGETIEEALRREAAEELGLTHFEPIELFQYLWHTEVESEWVCAFAAVVEEPLHPNPAEITEGRWWPWVDMMAAMATCDNLTPQFKQELIRLSDSPVARKLFHLPPKK